MRNSTRNSLALALALAVVAAAPTITPAATIYWDGTGTSWNLKPSWSTGAGVTTDPANLPGSADTVDFSTTATTSAQTITLDAAQSVKNIAVLATATGGITINSGTGGTASTLTLGSTGIAIASGAGAITINAPVILGAAQSWTNSGTNLLSVTGNVSNSTFLLTVAGTGNTSISGVIGNGSGGLTKTGTGTLTLSNTNTFTGNVTFSAASAGTIIVGANNALGTGTLTMGNATDTLQSSGNYSIANALNLGTAVIGGSNPLTFNGKVTDTSSGTGGNLTVNNTALTTFSGGMSTTNGGAARTFTISGSGNILVNSNIDYGNSTAALGGTIIYSGTGTMTLTGTNTYATSTGGATTITNALGTILATTPASMSGYNFAGHAITTLTGTIAVSMGGAGQWATADVDALMTNSTFTAGTGTLGINVDPSNSAIYSSSITKPGAFTKLGTGALTLTGTASTYAGATTLSAGSLTLSGDYSASSGLTAATGTTLISGGGLAFKTVTFNAGTATVGVTAGPGLTPINVTASGGLTNNATTTINVSGGGFAPATEYPIFQYAGTLAGTGSFVLGTQPARATGTLDTSVPGFVYFNVATTDSPKWEGNDGTNPHDWDINTTSNWQLITAGTPTKYLESDAVLFDDSATGTTAVTVTTNVNPSSVTFNNTATPVTGLTYTLSGPGKISGISTLSVQGGGLVNLNNANNYTGATSVSNGTLALGVADAISASAISVSGSGHLTQSVDNAISGTASLKIDGPTVTIANANSYAGGTTLHAGMLNINGDAALGAVPAAPSTNITFSGNATLQAGGAAVTLSPNRIISVASGVTATFDTNGNTMSIGAVTGATAAGLTKTGPGTLTVASHASYGGVTLISAGTLQLGATPGTLVAAPSILSSAVVNVDASTITGNPATVSSIANLGTGGGSFINNGAGITGTNTAPAYSSIAINGHAALVFAQGTSLGSLNAYVNQANNAISIFVVENQTSRLTGFPGELSFAGPAGSANDYTTPGNLAIEDNSDGSQVRPVSGSNVVGAAVTRPALGTPFVWGTVLNTSSTPSSATDVQTLAGTTTVTGTAANNVAFNINEMVIGGRFTNGASNGVWKGQIGQVLIFNTALSPTDRAAVEAYLTAQWTTDNYLPVTSPVQIAFGATLDLNGYSQKVDSLSDVAGAGGIVTNSAANPAVLTLATSGSTTFSGSIRDGVGKVGLTVNGAGTQVLTGPSNFSGATSILAGTLTLSVAGAISNSTITYVGGTLNETTDNAISDAAALIVNGPSLTLTLNHANNYSGGTTLYAGILDVSNASGSATGSGPVTLDGGKLISDPGSIAGTVLAGSGPHTISPGGDSAIGSLSVGGLTLNSNSTLRFDITDTATLDQIIDSGSLDFSGVGMASIQVPDLLADGTYPLITFNTTSLLDTSNFALSLIGGGTVPDSYTLVLHGSELDLQIPGVPEPASLGIIALGGIGLLRRRRH